LREYFAYIGRASANREKKQMTKLYNITGFFCFASCVWAAVDGEILNAALFGFSAVIFAGLLARPWAV
jgi:hypothetical protein